MSGVCRHLQAEDTVSERLRRWTQNPLGSARRGSNPLGVDCKRIGKLLGGVGDKRHRIVCNLSTEVKEGRKGMEEGKEEKERKERKEKKGS